MVKNPPANAEDVRDTGSIPGSGRFPGGGHGNPLQYSCPENSTDRGAWRATAHGVAKSWTRLKRFSMCTHGPLKGGWRWARRLGRCVSSDCHVERCKDVERCDKCIWELPPLGWRGKQWYLQHRNLQVWMRLECVIQAEVRKSKADVTQRRFYMLYLYLAHRKFRELKMLILSYPNLFLWGCDRGIVSFLGLNVSSLTSNTYSWETGNGQGSPQVLLIQWLLFWLMN